LLLDFTNLPARGSLTVCLSRLMRAATNMSRYFTRVHFRILLGFVLGFSALTAFWLSQQSPGDRRDNWNVAAILFTFSGPFTGAIARHFQSCCWKFSLCLAPYCACCLLIAVAPQFVPLPFRRGERQFRIVAWVLGLLGWFLGAPASFLHALS
jgi:hypothetical protein